MVPELGYRMEAVTKFDFPKLDGKMSFNTWKVQIVAILTQNGLKKGLGGKTNKPTTMAVE